MGYDVNGEYYLELRKVNNDDDEEKHTENRVKRSERVGELMQTDLVTHWIPKNCTTLFVNYYDGKEYPVTMNSRTQCSKLYEVAKSILLNSTYPHVPQRLELYRHNDYDEALRNDGKLPTNDATKSARIKQIETGIAKATSQFIAFRDGLVKKLEAEYPSVASDMKAIEHTSESGVQISIMGNPTQWRVGTMKSFLNDLRRLYRNNLPEDLTGLNRINDLTESLKEISDMQSANARYRAGASERTIVSRDLLGESNAMLMAGYIPEKAGLIPEQGEDTPCAGYRKAKIYIVCQREDGKCTPHYIFGNDPPTLENIVIANEDPIARTESNDEVHRKAIEVAGDKGFFHLDKAKAGHVKVFAASGQQVPQGTDPGADLPLCRYFGDSAWWCRLTSAHQQARWCLPLPMAAHGHR